MGAQRLPSGLVTFLFTDVEGSTRLLQEHGLAYADLDESRTRFRGTADGCHCQAVPPAPRRLTRLIKGGEPATDLHLVVIEHHERGGYSI
jgi:hypothetical protein